MAFKLLAKGSRVPKRWEPPSKLKYIQFDKLCFPLYYYCFVLVTVNYYVELLLFVHAHISISIK